MQAQGHQIAHFNIARLRAMPGDPLVAEFIDNVPKVNSIAERSPGFVWRLNDQSAQVARDIRFQAVMDDPLARQSEVDAAVEVAVKAKGRSTGGRAGDRGGKRSRRGR